MSIATVVTSPCEVCGTTAKSRHYRLCVGCYRIRQREEAAIRAKHAGAQAAPAERYHLSSYGERGARYQAMRTESWTFVDLEPTHRFQPQPHLDLAQDPTDAAADGKRWITVEGEPTLRSAVRKRDPHQLNLDAPVPHDLVTLEVPHDCLTTGEYVEDLHLTFNPLASAATLRQRVDEFTTLSGLPEEFAPDYPALQAALFLEDRGLEEHQYPRETNKHAAYCDEGETPSAAWSAWWRTLSRTQRDDLLQFDIRPEYVDPDADVERFATDRIGSAPVRADWETYQPGHLYDVDGALVYISA